MNDSMEGDKSAAIARAIGSEIAPWARQRKRGRQRFSDIISAPLRVLTFVFAPASAAFGAVFTQLPELVVFPVFVLLATGFISSLPALVERYTVLGNIPGIDFAISQYDRLRAYYFEHEPTIFASVLGVLARAFTEYRPYWNFVGLMSVVLVIDIAVSYGDTYPPYLSVGDAAYVLAMQIFFVCLITMSVLVPLTAVSFRYNLSGKRGRLRVMSLIALAMIGLAVWIGMETEQDDNEPSLLSQERIQLRMEKPDFREDLRETMEMFLVYNTFLEDTSAELTEKFQNLLRGIAPGDEAEAFAVTKYDDVFSEGSWLGVRYKDPNYGTMLMMTLSPELEVFERFGDLPEPVAEKLQANGVFDVGSDEAADLTCYGMILDYEDCQEFFRQVFDQQ
jgi:hypothetical protein